jgi:DNA repair exonuclease SbcCD ATPase subunit
MILFSKVRWKNILSTGDTWTEINFTKSKSTLIVGENGAGKSTILDAICFALYGKPFRKINKSQLINSINNKGLVVEIEFSIGSKQYLVRRGMKPNVFDIICNCTMLNQTSDVREYQEMFEKNILKLNFKSFQQIVILGSASFTPFMQLSAADRRSIIEDLLDIQIFSTMNSILKEKLQNNKEELVRASYDVKLYGEKIELHNKLTKTIQENKQATIDSKNKQLNDVSGNIVIALDVIKEHEKEIERLKGLITDEESVDESFSKNKLMLRSAEDKLRSIDESIQFLNDHENCPTCNQDINSTFREETLKTKQSKKQKIEKLVVEIENTIEEINKRYKEITDVHSLISNEQVVIRDVSTQIKIYESTHSLLSEEIESLKTQLDDQSTDDLEELNSYKRSLRAAINTKEDLLKDKSVLDVAAVLLKDSGVKTKIIKQYVPVINKLVNKYLAAMDFFVNFELNENFEESIKSRYRDDFSYESFSEGEKMRIDLSLLFTWRAISKLRNSASTNLLIMDEVFDSSLDSNGTEEFLKIISTLTADTNLFIISHKGDQLFDKFHSLIKFEKHKNFSRIVK